MKNKVLFKVIFSIFIIVALLSNISLAAYSDVTMTLEKDREVRIDITEYSYFEKKVIETDLDNKEVTIQLSVVNNEPPEVPTGELMIVLDNSLSMTTNKIGSETREQVVVRSAKSLISKLLDGNDQLKIGVVSFSSDPAESADGVLENDAKVISELTNSTTELSSAIDGMSEHGPRTDLDAGLTLAKQQFTSGSSAQKYIVVLTDGIPNIALGSINPYYSDEVISKTKTNLQTSESDGYHIITMLTGVTDLDSKPSASEKTYQEILEGIFGTTSNPTAGVFFNIQDSEIEQTITQSIFDALKPVYKDLTNIKVVDYFPQEIIDNFDFSYVSDATHGNISAEIDPETRGITWTIPKLDAGETATVQYKLKLKEEYDPQILDVLLNTNDGIDLDYDLGGEPHHQHSDESPQIKLTEPKKPDVAPIPLPKAGKTALAIAGIAIVGVAVFSLVKYEKVKRDLK